MTIIARFIDATSRFNLYFIFPQRAETTIPTSCWSSSTRSVESESSLTAATINWEPKSISRTGPMASESRTALHSTRRTTAGRWLTTEVARSMVLCLDLFRQQMVNQQLLWFPRCSNSLMELSFNSNATSFCAMANALTTRNAPAIRHRMSRADVL